MRKEKRILAFVLLAAMLLCLSGCGSFESQITKAAKKMDALQSFHFDMDMQLEMSVTMLGESVDMDMDMDVSADMQLQPMCAKMDMTVDMLGESTHVLSYVEQDGTDYVSYSSTNDSVFWDKETMTLDEFAALGGDMEQSMQMFIACADSFEKTGTEQVNGADTTRYDGEISGESVRTAVASGMTFGAMSEGLDMDLDELDDADLGSIPCSLWIDNKSRMLVRYDMDMTQVMGAVVGSLKEAMLEKEGLEGVDMDLSIGKVTTSVVLSRFDQVDEIQIPEGVKAAAERDAAILGTWRANVDCRDQFLEELSDMDDTDLKIEDYVESFVLPISMSFTEDGCYSLRLDSAAFQEEMGRFGNAMGNFLNDYFAEIVMEAMIATGYADGSETVEQLEAILGMSMDEFITYQFGMSVADMAAEITDGLVSTLQEICLEANYVAQGGKLYTSESLEDSVDPDEYESYEISGNTLTIISGSDEENDWLYPLVLEKQN